jgi:hypothetical protein
VGGGGVGGGGGGGGVGLGVGVCLVFSWGRVARGGCLVWGSLRRRGV